MAAHAVVCAAVGVVPEVIRCSERVREDTAVGTYDAKRMAVGFGESEHRRSPAAVDLEPEGEDEEEKEAGTMCGKLFYAILWYFTVSAGVILKMTITLPDSTSASVRAQVALAGSLN